MTSTKSKAAKGKRPSTKWALAAVILLVAYGLLQPIASQRWGWKLPNVGVLLGQGESSSDSQSTDTVQSGSSAASTADNTTVSTHGYLREIGEAEFLSPTGLRYTTGSQEGHRLLHLARHLSDQPDRPGLHGVFKADMPQVLRWLDEVYQRAEGGERGTNKNKSDGRIVYEADFQQPVGYVGGREGKKDGNPAARSIRLVTEGKRVITAFPL